MTTSTPPGARTRRWYGIAAAGTLIVTMIFATVGDGVEVSEATGLRHTVIAFGHTLVWALLTVAFVIAAVRGQWSKPSQIVAVAAAISYGLFLFAVFIWP